MKYLVFQKEDHIVGGEWIVRLLVTTLSPEGYIVPSNIRSGETSLLAFDTEDEAREKIQATRKWHAEQSPDIQPPEFSFVALP